MRPLLALSIIVAATPLDAQITKSDTATMVSPSVWTGPDTLTGRGRQARDVVNALRRKLPPTESVVSVTFSGDSTAQVQTGPPNGGATYTLHKKQGKWVVSDTSMIKIYRQSQLTKRLTFKPLNGNPVLFTDTISGTRGADGKCNVEYWQPRHGKLTPVAVQFNENPCWALVEYGDWDTPRPGQKAETAWAKPTSMLPEALTREDSLAIRKAARAFVNNEADTSAAFAQFGFRGDAVLVPTWVSPQHIGFTNVRVVRRDGRWVAVSNEGLGIR